MFASPFFIVLAWGLLLAPVADAAAPRNSEMLAGVRRIDLREVREPIPEIHIGPGLTTTVLFDSTIRPDEVVLEGRERFQRLGLSEDHLVLVPSSTFQQGEHLRLEIRFRDDAAPERVAFMLVVDPEQVERQVELFRRPRTAESYRQEVEELKSGMSRLRQEVARLHSSPELSGEGGALAATVARLDDVRQRPLTFGREENSAPVSVKAVQGVRLAGLWMALRLNLAWRGRGEGGWVAAGASLRDSQGRLVMTRRPWQGAPLTPWDDQFVVIASEHEASLPAGRYTLKLWDESGGQTVTLEGLEVR
ncbi:DUF2381 family protein [Pyxidicoccus parkwayensis]|uniref:DUF2381 family protein n=1 Tax=Pyxidicoccus parkwayensis TaxID=2813578 RepID=A0ABX7NMB8_9BACT|nr:DUF2381 family protein [Pyxidicoccus parkwaysis]QSQ18730.1 DUF2381 family protein [Pyxidicoccus parkwaysis]